MFLLRFPFFFFFFFVNDTATTEIYTVSDTLSLHDALPIARRPELVRRDDGGRDGERRQRGALERDGESRDDVGRRPRDRGGRDRLDGAVAVFRVVLRDVDEGDGGDDADHTAQGEVPPGGGVGRRLEQPVRTSHEPGRRQH